MTICSHVNDCKLSHIDPVANDLVIDHLRKEYEIIFEDGSGKMVVSRGRVHTYLGIKLDFTVRGQVKITMFDYVEEILNAFYKTEPSGAGTKTSAALENLFVVDEDREKLTQDRVVQFHNLVVKILYATKRARPDTCTAIAFLTTRVRAPDFDDWVKLTHLMHYIRGTRALPLILSVNGSRIFKWWVDASFAVHPNMRGHSGGGFSMGRGFPIVGSTKQKINTRSSTECEIVGADDFMPAICWTRCFMEAQGYHVEDNILFQDNKSSMLLERNGKASSGKQTRHINIRYFFITDRVMQGKVSLVWYPTGDMIRDFATKPLQGSLFKKFGDQIMGFVDAKDPGPGKRPATEPVKTRSNSSATKSVESKSKSASKSAKSKSKLATKSASKTLTGESKCHRPSNESVKGGPGKGPRGHGKGPVKQDFQGRRPARTKKWKDGTEKGPAKSLPPKKSKRNKSSVVSLGATPQECVGERRKSQLLRTKGGPKGHRSGHPESITNGQE